MTDKPNPTYCAHCGCEGPFDGNGRWPRKVTRKRSGVETTYRQIWFHYHCPECANQSAILQSEDEISTEELLP